MSITLERGSDNLVEWSGMTETSDGAYLNGATVTMTLYSGYSRAEATGVVSGTVITGATSLALSYVSGSNGTYQGVIPSTVTLSLALVYTLQVTATYGGYVRVRALAANVINGTT